MHKHLYCTVASFLNRSEFSISDLHASIEQQSVTIRVLKDSLHLMNEIYLVCNFSMAGSVPMEWR